MKSSSPYGRYLRWITAIAGVYFAIVALLSLTVDPWRINQTPLSIDALDSAREISECVRVGKAALANRGGWETVILGSSRVEIGLNPQHPAFADSRTVNLGMSAASVLETVPVGYYTLERNPDLKTLIFGIEPGDLHDESDSRRFPQFYQSPFGDNDRSIERSINQIIGGRSLLDSISTIQRYSSGKKPDRSPLGQWVNPNYPGNVRNYTESAIKMGFDSPVDSWALRPQILREQKAEQLRDFIKDVRARGITMHILIPPQHALKQIHPELDQPDSIYWEADLLALLEICNHANSIDAPAPKAQLWSFLTFNEYTTRSLPDPSSKIKRMEGWFDLGHAKQELGNHVIETILYDFQKNDSDQTYGVNLTTNDWATIREKWIADHKHYCELRANDVAWRRLLHKNQLIRTK